MSTTEQDHSGELQVYEIGYLMLPSIPEDKLPEAVANLEKIVTTGGGKLLDSEAPFRRNLAYSMSKVVGSSKYVVNDAYMGWLKFEAEPSVVEAIKLEVEKMAEMLRFLLIKAPRETTFTFAMAREAIMAKEAAERAPVEEETEPEAESDSDEDKTVEDAEVVVE